LLALFGLLALLTLKSCPPYHPTRTPPITVRGRPGNPANTS
jgi:hypothetical protein